MDPTPNHPVPPVSPPPQSDWGLARPERVPEPTVWPPAFALAVTLLLWGIITSWIIISVGGVLLVISLAGWIANIRHERKTQ